jgi:ABC-type Mn2+/Zn2+ transport system ATPase subunit
MNYRNQIQKAADEYRKSTGFSPQQYDQSSEQSDVERFSALKSDIKWFEDHASEAKQRVERLLRDIDTNDLSNK